MIYFTSFDGFMRYTYTFITKLLCKKNPKRGIMCNEILCSSVTFHILYKWKTKVFYENVKKKQAYKGNHYLNISINYRNSDNHL